MNAKRFALTTIVIVLFAVAWNGIVHLVILREADSVLDSIRRPGNERSMTLSLLITVLLAVLFVWSYAQWARQGDLRDGLTHGLFFGVLTGVVVDLNQYVLYPLPASLVLAWFVSGMIEFCAYGILASRLYPIRRDPAG